MTLHWPDSGSRSPDRAVAASARERQNRLTKPTGALGELETLAIRLAALQGTGNPTVERVAMATFAEAGLSGPEDG